MAFEKSDQMKDYIGGCLEKYKKDKDIFKKTLTMIDFYMKRSDWPNCIEDLEEKARLILNENIITLTWGAGKYINNSQMKWDGITDDFKENYVYFYNCIAEVYNHYYWNGRFSPNGIDSVSYTELSEGTYYIKLAKNNGEKIEIEMDSSEILSLISNLSDIIKEKSDENR